MASRTSRQVKRTLTAIEALRIGTALVPYGLPFSGDVWIVMSHETPNEVHGVYATMEDADRAASPLPPKFVVYGPFTPPKAVDYPKILDVFDPIGHDITNPYPLRPVGEATAAEVQLKTVSRMTLTIEHSDPPRTAVFECNPHTDVIFMTQAAREAFMYPRYYSIFGTEHVKHLRARLIEQIAALRPDA